MQDFTNTTLYLTFEEKVFFKGMNYGEATEMAYELNIQASICMAYLVGTPKAPKANKELNRWLEKAQNTNEEALSTTLKVADKAYELNIRASIFMAYLVGTPKATQYDLEQALKANEELNRPLEEAVPISLTSQSIDGKLMDIPPAQADEVSLVVQVEDVEEEEGGEE
ncbi:hypothetical protein V8G54_010532 [Vigna mungo]|uniref:Uncharacterized protein n=1 Tax=Vigna mungo TaxID=3915 RepID=A0AAQ3NWQ8_VIGMU